MNAVVTPEWMLAHLRTLTDDWLNDNASRLVMRFDKMPEKFVPASDRNYSGQCLAKLASQGLQFEIRFAFSEDAQIEVSYLPPDHKNWREVKVPGSGPRAETIAAIIAALLKGEMENR